MIGDFPKRTVIVVCMMAGMAIAEPAPDVAPPAKAERISIAPTNRLSALKVPGKKGSGFGSAVCGAETSEAYREGHAIGAWNNHHGKRNLLVIDDGKTEHPVMDRETRLPLIILTNAKVTRELEDAVKGYNQAMRAGGAAHRAGR